MKPLLFKCKQFTYSSGFLAIKEIIIPKKLTERRKNIYDKSSTLVFNFKANIQKIIVTIPKSKYEVLGNAFADLKPYHVYFQPLPKLSYLIFIKNQQISELSKCALDGYYFPSPFFLANGKLN